MEITEIRVTLRDEERLKGFANVTFDEAFVVRGMKIIQGKERNYVESNYWNYCSRSCRLYFI